MNETAPPACNDCGAEPGGEHLDACDVARCLVTGLQRLMCDAGHECGQDVWTGVWPGAAECAEYNWPMFPRASPEELPDLNRLIMQAQWDQQARRWRLPSDPVDDTFYVHWHVERGLSLPPARYTLNGVTVPEEALPALLTAITENTAPSPPRPDVSAATRGQRPENIEFPQPATGPSSATPRAARSGRPGTSRSPQNKPRTP